MGIWSACGKAVAILYLIMVLVSESTGSISVALLFILLYICLGTIQGLIKNKAAKNLTMLAGVIGALLCSLYVNRFFSLLIPGVLLELVFGISGNIIAAAISLAIPIILVRDMPFAEYVLVSLLSLTIFVLSYKSFMRIKSLDEETDNLRKNTDTLRKKLLVNEEYQRQLKYVSQLEERNAIARKIHDSIGHSITGSIIQLRAALLLAEKDAVKTKRIIETVIDVLDKGMESIRETLGNIKPQTGQMGVNRLKELLDEFTQRTSIITTFVHDRSIDALSGLQWRVIIENTTEALTNSLKHSGCGKIEVSLKSLNKMIKCEIRDNGRGASVIKKGIGLKGIEERCEEAGGKVIIDGSKGFSIIMLFPVKEDDGLERNKSADCG